MVVFTTGFLMGFPISFLAFSGAIASLEHLAHLLRETSGGPLLQALHFASIMKLLT